MTIEAPNISRLAREGVTFTNAFSPSPVCSPSRASLALGLYPSSIGANHMRTTSHTEATGLPKYEAVPPIGAEMLSQSLRRLGYFTTNNYKTDYQFNAPKGAWDESSRFAHWRNREDGQPFFAVVNFTTSHESGLFEPYGIREVEKRHYLDGDEDAIMALPEHHLVKTNESETPIHLPEDTDFPIPPYLPDNPVVRRDIWKMYNNLAETDRQIGAVLEQLEADGLLETTVIMFYSDHGGPLPRQKRLIYDSGLRVPLIVRFPDGLRAGSIDDQLISFVDFVPTTLGLAGSDGDIITHGKDFLNPDTEERQYIHAAADRFDGFTDAIRAVRDKRFKYIRNYQPEQPYYLPVTYREKIPTMRELLRLRDASQLTAVQAQWFRSSKPEVELFDTVRDPHELNNIADEPGQAERLLGMQAEMDRWLIEIGDDPTISERSLIETLWNGSGFQPVTEEPNIVFKHGLISLNTSTDGASISYRIIKGDDQPTSWRLYSQPFVVQEGAVVEGLAHRIGWLESRVVVFSRSEVEANGE